MLLDPATPRDDRTFQGHGLVLRMSNDEMEAERQAEQARQADAAQSRPLITSLSGHIDMCWNANKRAKQKVEAELLSNLRQREGEYDDAAAAQIKDQGGSDVFIRISSVKSRAAKAWLKEIMIPANEVPFHLDPTPVPELPPEYHAQAKQEIIKGLLLRMQERGIPKEELTREDLVAVAEQVKTEMVKAVKEEAKTEMDELTTSINDEVTEGNWYGALEDVIDDIVDFKTGFITGPYVVKEPVLEWSPGPDGKSAPKVVKKLVKKYRRISPFDIYPSAGAKSIQDGNLIERMRLSRKKLSGFIGVDGFDEYAIRRVLDLYGIGGLRQWLQIDNQRANLESRHDESSDPEALIDCLKFMGSVQGKMLREWGMSVEEIPDPDIDYEIIAYKVGPFVISARLNPHPLGKRRYYCASFERKNDSIWGNSLMDILCDIQRICNACARALVNNMGMASGPQMWAIVDRIPPEISLTAPKPWKVWQFTSEQTSGRGDIPMGFFQPNVIVGELLQIYKFFNDQGSDISGIPAYVYGSDKVSGAGRTLGGLTMLMNAASKGLKQVAGNIDSGIIKPSIEEHWLQIMLTDQDRARGDVKVVPRASDYLIQMEQMQLRIAEVLQNTANPIDMQIMGPEGRAEILREHFKHLKLPVDRIIPDRESIVQETSQAKIAEFVTSLAAKLGTDPQSLMQIAQQGERQAA
jgi:hypothetical protein